MHKQIIKTAKKYAKYFNFCNELLKFKKNGYTKIDFYNYKQNNIDVEIVQRDIHPIFLKPEEIIFNSKFTIDNTYAYEYLEVGYIEHGLSLMVKGIFFKKNVFKYTWKGIILK